MSLINKLSTALGVKKREAHVLVIGLDNSGKSTILNQMKTPEQQSTNIQPTVGFNVERFQTKTLSISAFDMSGQGRYRNLWEQYYKETNGIVFVVDATDKLRVPVAKEELWLMLQHADMSNRRIPILLFANKIDERNALSAVEVSQSLALEKVRGKPWHIVASNALAGDGLADGMDWLSHNIKDSMDNKT